MLYIACLAGAAGLYLLLRPGSRAVTGIGTLSGLGGLAWLFVSGLSALAGDGGRPGAFFAAFALIAIIAAVRMVTNPRPVYAALHFIFVVLSAAGLFLLLEAEFMAFALVIVYAGAILITYMFVLMLARQAPDEAHPEALADYDALPREPLAATTVGFVLLALLSNMMTTGQDIPRPDSAQREAVGWQELELMPLQLEQVVHEFDPEATPPPGGFAVQIDSGEPRVTVMSGGTERVITLPESARPDNIQRVGLALVAKFPASLEVAGIILLMAMFGAVVLARRQIELGEDDTREAAGLRRFDFARDDAIAPDGEPDA